MQGMPPATVINRFHYPLFAKQVASDLLCERRIVTLVITGSETDVRASDAVDRGYRAAVAVDAASVVFDEVHVSLPAF